MARVEWTALSGPEVESVVSNLLYSQHPRAVRVRPTQGDFGIDVLIPNESNPDVNDVYQIKKFATNLTGNQKKQIEESFRRLMVGLVRRGIEVGDWCLVMPLDPTIDNALDWFKAMPADVVALMFTDEDLALTSLEKGKISAWLDAPGRIVEWKGHAACEALAGKYWYVIDYYLHGGSERIRSAVSDVAKILQRDLALPDANSSTATSILEPSEVKEHLLRLQNVLDGDPHFRYGVSLDPVLVEIGDEPGLVAATQEVGPDGSCLTFRIFARFAESLNERPVPIQLTFEFEEGTPEEAAFKEWQKYGKPYTGPASIDADLPGGLGGAMDVGKVHVTAADGGTKFDARYRLVSPDGAVLAEILFAMSSTKGLDGTGVWTHGVDASGTLSTDGQVDTTTLNSNIEFSLGDLTGREGVATLPALEFAAHLVHPNMLQIAGKYGPFSDLRQIPWPEALLPEPVARYVRAIAAIQTRSSAPILIPDLSTVSHVQALERTASLINGHILVGTWDQCTFEVDPGLPIDPEAHYQLAVIEPLSVTIGADEITVGAVQHTLLSVKLSLNQGGFVSARPHLNNTVHKAFAPEEPVPTGPRKPVRSRILPPDPR